MSRRGFYKFGNKKRKAEDNAKLSKENEKKKEPVKSPKPTEPLFGPAFIFPSDILRQYFVKLCPFEFLRVSKDWNRIAHPEIIRDPRLPNFPVAVGFVKAAERGFLNTVKLLYCHEKVDKDAVLVALNDACANRHCEILEFLLKEDKTGDIQRDDSFDLFSKAIAKRYYDIFKILLASPKIDLECIVPEMTKVMSNGAGSHDFFADTLAKRLNYKGGKDQSGIKHLVLTYLL